MLAKRTKKKEVEVLDPHEDPNYIEPPMKNEIVATPQESNIASAEVFDPVLKVQQAQQAATAVMLVAKPIDINGKQFLRFEDWQLIGSFYNVTSGIDWVKALMNGQNLAGYNAMAIVYKNGVKIGSAEATCLRTEKKWSTAPEFQVKSMAQTRAMAKALRSVLGHVAVLAGYEATPAEEMDSTITVQATPSSKPVQQTSPPVGVVRCPVHKTPMKFYPAGVSQRTGNAYGERYSCSAKSPAGEYCKEIVWVDSLKSAATLNPELQDGPKRVAKPVPVQEELPVIQIEDDESMIDDISGMVDLHQESTVNVDEIPF